MQSGPNHTVNCLYYTNWAFTDATAGRHNLGLFTSANDPSECPNIVNEQVLSAGDLAFRATVPSFSIGLGGLQVADSDGTTYSFAGTVHGLATQVEDRNGNQVTIQDISNGAFSETDTLGRPVLSSSGFGVTGNTVTVSGLGGLYTVTWGTTTYNINPGSIQVDPSGLDCIFPPDNGSLPVITAIKLPNGLLYKFLYDSAYGLLKKITYPSGGTISYNWGISHLAAFASLPDSSNLNPAL
jgi:hypothetical protein